MPPGPIPYGPSWGVSQPPERPSSLRSARPPVRLRSSTPFGRGGITTTPLRIRQQAGWLLDPQYAGAAQVAPPETTLSRPRAARRALRPCVGGACATLDLSFEKYLFYKIR